jgi:RNA-binding protein YlmH
MNEYVNKATKNESEKLLVARLFGLAARASEGVSGYSDFLDLRQQDLARAVAVNSENIKWELNGGYDEAERKRLFIYPFWETKTGSHISCLKISHKEFPGQAIGHRDYLGAILNLGLKREKLGDIVLQENLAFLFADNEIADYITQQLTRVRHSTVSAEIIVDHDFVFNPPLLTTLQVNLSSLRLDAAIAAVFNLSRSQVDNYIESGEARINHLEVNKPSSAIKVGDLVSVRGLGRFRLEELGGLSRKGRQFVKICRW